MRRIREATCFRLRDVPGIEGILPSQSRAGRPRSQGRHKSDVHPGDPDAASRRLARTTGQVEAATRRASAGWAAAPIPGQRGMTPHRRSTESDRDLHPREPRADSLLDGDVPDHDGFLEQRRSLMAQKIKTYSEGL